MIYVEIADWPAGSTATFSARAISFDGYQSEPRLMKEPEIRREMPFMPGLSNCTAAVLLADYDRSLTERLNEEPIRGKTLRVINTTHGVLFTGRITGSPDVDGFTLPIKADTFSLLEGPVNKTIEKDEFDNAPDESVGKPGNYIYGTANKKPGMFPARMVDGDTGKYLAAWNSLSGISGVIDESGADVTTAIDSWEVDPVTGYTYIYYTAAAGGDLVLKFSALGPESSGQLIKNPARMLEALIADTATPFSLDNITVPETVFNERVYNENFLFVHDLVKWKDFLKYFMETFACRVFVNRAANIEISILAWDNELPSTQVEPAQVKDFKPSRVYDYLAFKFRRFFQFTPAENVFARQSADIKNNSSLTLTFVDLLQRFIFDDNTSKDSASRTSIEREAPLDVATFQLHRSLAFGIELAAVLEVKSARNFVNEYRLIQVLSWRTISGSGFILIYGYDVTTMEKLGFQLDVSELEDDESKAAQLL